jgi:hypothetical protein
MSEKGVTVNIGHNNVELTETQWNLVKRVADQKGVRSIFVV